MPRLLVTDRAVALRLEAAEGRANAASVEARAAAAPDSGATWTEVEGTLAMFDGPASPLTQTFGLGMLTEPTARALDEIESFFSARGAATNHETCPLGDSRLLQLLPARGYLPIEQSTVLFQPLGREMPTGDGTGAIHVRVAGPSESLLWATTASRGWGESPELARFVLEFGKIASRASGVVCFLAECRGEPAAAAALAIHDGVALLAGASTVPEFRGQGIQSALLRERLTYGARAGCDLAMMAALPGSESQRNGERHGFRIAYTRTKWRKALAGV